METVLPLTSDMDVLTQYCRRSFDLPAASVEKLTEAQLIKSIKISAFQSAKPQFSPLTPYQTEDSLPPPVYGTFKKRPNYESRVSDVQVSKSSFNISNNKHGFFERKNQKNNGKISGVSLKELPSSLSSNKIGSKTWKLPSGAKLIGYNMQMFAGYIPAVYLENSSKTNKGMKTPGANFDNYKEYYPGYSKNMNESMDSSYKNTRRNDAVVAETKWTRNDTVVDDKSFPEKNIKSISKLDDKSIPDKSIVKLNESIPELNEKSIFELNDKSVPELNDKSVPELNDKSVPELNDKSVPELNDKSVPELNEKFIPNINPTGGSNSLIKEQQEVNVNKTINEIMSFDDSLWPAVATGTDEEVEEFGDASKSESELIRSTANSSVESISVNKFYTDLPETNLRDSHRNLNAPKTITMNYSKLTPKADGELLAVTTVMPLKSASFSSFTFPIGSRNVTDIDSVDTAESRRMHELRSKLQSNPEIDFHEKNLNLPDTLTSESVLVSEVPQQSVVKQQNPYYTDELLYNKRSTLLASLEKSSELVTPLTSSEMPNKIFEQRAVSTVKKNVQENEFLGGTIIPIVEQPHELSKANTLISELSYIEAAKMRTSQSPLVSSSTATIKMLTTTFDVDSAEFADEDYENAVRNMNDKMKSTTKFVKLENDAVEQEEMNASEEENRKMNQNPGKNEGDVTNRDDSREIEIPKENSMDYNDHALGDTSERGKVTKMNMERSGREKKKNTNRADEINRKGKTLGDYDDDVNSEREQAPDDEASREQEGSEEGKEMVTGAAIPFPEQIPSFQEWLSSLPIQPGFLFGMNNSGSKSQSTSGSINMPFSKQFGRKNKASERKGRHQYDDEPEVEKSSVVDDDPSDSEESEKRQKQHFSLPRNVPYQS